MILLIVIVGYIINIISFYFVMNADIVEHRFMKILFAASLFVPFLTSILSLGMILGEWLV